MVSCGSLSSGGSLGGGEVLVERDRPGGRVTQSIETELAHSTIGSTLKTDHLVEIGMTNLLERQRTRFLGKHLQLGSRYHLGLALDLGRIAKRHEVGTHQVGDAPAAGGVHVNVGEGIVRASCTPRFWQ
jgi:hypothetical protein